MPPPQGSLELTPLPVPHGFLLCEIPISYYRHTKGICKGIHHPIRVTTRGFREGCCLLAPIGSRSQVLESMGDAAQAELQVGREVAYLLAVTFQAPR